VDIPKRLAADGEADLLFPFSQHRARVVYSSVSVLTNSSQRSKAQPLTTSSRVHEFMTTKQHNYELKPWTYRRPTSSFTSRSIVFRLCSTGFALTWYRALAWYSSPARPFAAPCLDGRSATRYRAAREPLPRVPTAFQGSNCVRGGLKRRAVIS